MLGGSDWLLEVRRVVLADGQQAICKAWTLFPANAIKPFANGNRHGGCHALASQCRQLLGDPTHVLVVDVNAHALTFLSNNLKNGAVAELVGIEDGVVAGVFNLESSGVEAPDWRPRHDEP